MKKIIALSMSVLVLSVLADGAPMKPLQQDRQKLKEIQKKEIKLQEERMKKKSYPRGNIETH